MLFDAVKFTVSGAGPEVAVVAVRMATGGTGFGLGGGMPARAAVALILLPATLLATSGSLALADTTTMVDITKPLASNPL